MMPTRHQHVKKLMKNIKDAPGTDARFRRVNVRNIDGKCINIHKRGALKR